MPDDFIVARNPDPDSTLPYLLRIPLGEQGIVLKSKDTWPRTSKVYCHRAQEWPADAEIVERVPTRVCTSRGAAIDLVLDRRRESRSQFVLSRAKGAGHLLADPAHGEAGPAQRPDPDRSARARGR